MYNCVVTALNMAGKSTIKFISIQAAKKFFCYSFMVKVIFNGLDSIADKQ